MKTRKKALLLTLAAIVFWFGLFIGCFMNWGNLIARQMQVKYSFQGYEQGGIVLAGSSTIQKWNTSSADLAPLPSVNVGIGGSVVRSWEAWADKKKIAPIVVTAAVVLYVGANDMHNEKKAPAIVADELEKLFSHIHQAVPNATIYYVSVYATRSHAALRVQDEELGRLAAGFAGKTDYLRYIDCVTAFIDSEEELFERDGVHLNKEGYVLWTGIIRDALAADGLAADRFSDRRDHP